MPTWKYPPTVIEVMESAQRISELESTCQKLELRAAEAEALMINHEGHIRELETKVETLNMQLVACSTAALGCFTDCCENYKSVALQDVLNLRAKNKELEAEVVELKARIAELECTCQKLEFARAEATALVISHESHIAELEAQVASLRTMLKKHEFCLPVSCDSVGNYACPECKMPDCYGKHMPDCKLAQALKESTDD